MGRLLELFYRLIEIAGTDPDVRLSALPSMDECGAAPGARRPDGLGGGEEPEAEDRARAARLTPMLRRLGVAPGAKVGLLLEPSPERRALALAVRGLGGVALPLDPGKPDVRLAVLLADTGLAVLIHRGPLPEAW